MDWQLITVLIVIAGAAVFVTLRVVRLFGRRAKESTACGGSCHGCGPQSVSTPLLPLDAPRTTRGPE